ncbi:YHYH domain-containing protein [Paenibacillus sp. GCM10027626]|uniref:YHYH domain-containing protein n=1 Tax=Paenibacillus sp. GCM10027626 TaxID=3273411 RepID=UPI003640F060
MKRLSITVVIASLLAALLIPAAAFAHSGRLDSNGGHNCSEKSKRKGLCTGYHYHRGPNATSSKPKASSSTTKKKSTTTTAAAPKPKAKPASPVTDKGVEYSSLNTTLKLDNKAAATDKKLVSVQNNTYIYVRDFAKVFNLTLDTDKSKNIILSKKGYSLKIHTSTNKIDLNGKYSGFNSVTIGGLTYLPLRFAVQSTGASISKADGETVHISSKAVKAK